ncbi:MAG: hypothetical protein ACQEQO_07050 [Thermodesulfobacteriota bacterium]
MGFFSVPRLSGWSFQHPSLQAGGSTSRRLPVTSENSTLSIRSKKWSDFAKL